MTQARLGHSVPEPRRRSLPGPPPKTEAEDKINSNELERDVVAGPVTRTSIMPDPSRRKWQGKVVDGANAERGGWGGGGGSEEWKEVPVLPGWPWGDRRERQGDSLRAIQRWVDMNEGWLDGYA